MKERLGGRADAGQLQERRSAVGRFLKECSGGCLGLKHPPAGRKLGSVFERLDLHIVAAAPTTTFPSPTALIIGEINNRYSCRGR